MPSLDVEPAKEERRELGSMSLLQHLEELRKRIINSMLAIVVGFFVAFWFHDQIYDWMSKPIIEAFKKLHQNPELNYSNPTHPFNLYLKLALIAGIFLSSPVVLYQVWMFISPGLYRREKRYVIPFLFLSVGLFVGGGFFGYRIVFPVAMEFLMSYAKNMHPVIMITEYTSLFLTIILGLAIMFELPIVIGFTALMGVVDAKFLFKHIRGAVFLFFVIAAVLTPTTDILNMTIYAAPMIALYILSIGIAWLVHPRQRRKRKDKKIGKQ
jgi:sec-independent protein translocase protein TatC